MRQETINRFELGLSYGEMYRSVSDWAKVIVTLGRGIYIAFESHDDYVEWDAANAAE